MSLFNKNANDHARIIHSITPPPRLIFKEIQYIITQAIEFDNRSDNETRDYLLISIKSKIERFLKTINSKDNTKKNLSPEQAERFKREIKDFQKKQGY